MRIERLRLTDFRNYAALDLTLPGGLVIFTGRNAQGKSNILEAVALAATSRSFRTGGEREIVRWGGTGSFARVDATVLRRRDTLHVEVIVADAGTPLEGAPARRVDPTLPTPPPPQFRKRIKVNGTARRAMDLLGLVTVVVFAPTDLDLVIGPPTERRRFIDMTLCQVSPAYCRALSAYQKVIAQRSALLRRIREGEDGPQSLGFWDEQLAALAAPIMRERAALLAWLEGSAAEVYATLARDEGEGEAGEVDDGGDVTPEEGEAVDGGGRLRLQYRPSFDGALEGDDATVARALRERLATLRRREVAQGANVLGPHRDDVHFLAGEVNLATYGSRGQQRSVALALKLAELRYIEARTGDQPILLLDDVLSELDLRRRADLLAATRTLDQTLLTTTDASAAPEEARRGATILRVRGGRVFAT